MADRMSVLHSLPGVRPTTNPYLVMLRERVRALPDVDLLDFSYRRAITGRYQVFHVHWPETLLGGASPLKQAVRQLLLVLFLLRMTLLRVPVVRTVHNVQRPEGLRRHEYALLSWFDRLTTLQIHLNEHTAGSPALPWVVIPHGHYREWFARFPLAEAVPGRFGYAGLVRRYKGVETLISAFRAIPDPLAGSGISLRVGGRPSSPELAQVLDDLAGQDARIELQLQFLSEAEFAEVLSSAELVVLPYRFMHNSGGVLATLSLDRPVLVPDNEVNRSLAAEVGPGWVHTFSDELDADDLARALNLVRAGSRPDARPDLSRREWDEAGRAHGDAYRQAVEARRRLRAVRQQR